MSAETAAAVSEIFNAPESATPAPAAETPAGAPAAPNTPPPATPAAAKQYFLELDERTKYETADDAKKGWGELKSLADRLRPFEQLMKPVSEGGFGLTADAAIKHLDAYASELFQRQSATPATPGARSDAATVDAAARGDKVAYESLDPAWKAHVDRLKQLGYVTEDRLKPIEAKLAAFDAQAAEKDIEITNAAVAHGETLLQGILKEKNISMSDDDFAELGQAIGSKIDRDSYDANGKRIPGSIADSFIRGNEATRREIILKQANVFLKFGDTYAKSRTATAAADKTAAMNSQSRTLPAAGTPTPATPGDRSKMSRDDKDRDRQQRVKALLEAAGV
jgi:hypothetical protein